MVKKYGRKMEVGRVKSEKESFGVYGYRDGKIGREKGLTMKNKWRFGVKAKKVSEKRRNLMDFGEELKV